MCESIVKSNGDMAPTNIMQASRRMVFDGREQPAPGRGMTAGHLGFLISRRPFSFSFFFVMYVFVRLTNCVVAMTK